MDANIISIVRSWFDKSSDWQKDTFINLWKSKDIEETKKRALKLVCKEYGYIDCFSMFLIQSFLKTWTMSHPMIVILF